MSSNWKQFHTELTFLKETFQRNDYLGNFIDIYFKKFLNHIHLVKERAPTMEKKTVTSNLSIPRYNIFAN